MSYIIIYSTFPDVDCAKKICDSLLKKKLIACVNYHMITSSYLDKGEIKNCDEISVIIKSLDSNYEKVRKFIEKKHPYEIPVVTKVNIELNEIYANWLDSELSN